MRFDTRQTLRKRLRFLFMIAAVLYVLVSIAIAIMTVDDCGDEDSPKHWSFFPPEWVCEPR
jgi:hypothetical protein